MANQKLAKQYQKKTDREHILDAPDTYIGSVDSSETFLDGFITKILVILVLLLKSLIGFQDSTNYLMKVWLIVATTSFV